MTKKTTKPAPKPATSVKPRRSRVFKLTRFAATAKKAGISDVELCRVTNDLDRGLGENLGGNVWKKRILRNEYRTLLINRVGEWWIFTALYAKDKLKTGDIPDSEVDATKTFAKKVNSNPVSMVDAMLERGLMTEICKNGKS